MERNEYHRLQDAAMVQAGELLNRVERGEITIERAEATIAATFADLERAKEAVTLAEQRKTRLRRVSIGIAIAAVGVALLVYRLAA